jgi:uncharacterized protein with HEPN domain
MSRDPTLYLQDIQEGCQKILAYTRDMSFAEFAADAKTIDAVARNLEVIREAVKRLPAEWRRSHTDIEWRKIAGLRDMLIHAYFGVDIEILWDVAQNKSAQCSTFEASHFFPDLSPRQDRVKKMGGTRQFLARGLAQGLPPGLLQR